MINKCKNLFFYSYDSQSEIVNVGNRHEAASGSFAQQHSIIDDCEVALIPTSVLLISRCHCLRWLCVLIARPNATFCNKNSSISVIGLDIFSNI